MYICVKILSGVRTYYIVVQQYEYNVHNVLRWNVYRGYRCSVAIIREGRVSDALNIGCQAHSGESFVICGNN